ncbi:MAG: quinone oxidoreductase [Paracoccaceae bacterium]
MTDTTRAFQYQEHGGPEVLQFLETALGSLAPSDIQLRHTAIGVNFLDIYHRCGKDPSLKLPSGIGVEGVGIVEAIGAEITTFAVGDRVAYVGGPPGAYAIKRNIPAARAVKVPDGIDDHTIAALIFKGMTAEYLIHRCFAVQSGEVAVVHAAAGGVGSIASQWLRALGAIVIGVVGSEAKMEKAIENGCHHVLLSDDPELASKVRALSGGAHVVYDSVGALTFEASLNSLRPRGTLVSFGASSGPPPKIDVGDLTQRGSLYLTRPSIAHYASDRLEYQQGVERLFKAIADGVIKTSKPTVMKLADAVRAHEQLEGRQTMGSIILVPDEAD